MVTGAISKEACDLIQGNPFPQNHGVAREGAARVWIRRVSYLSDPAWRDPGTKRRDGREEEAAERTLHLLKRLVGNPEVSKDELKILNRLFRVSVHSNPPLANGVGQTKQDRQGPHRGLSALKPDLQVSRPSKPPGVWARAPSAGHRRVDSDVYLNQGC